LTRVRLLKSRRAPFCFRGAFAPGARGFNRGAIYMQGGTLVASVAQEGLIRPR
jgi:acyl-CoA thioesterase